MAIFKFENAKLLDGTIISHNFAGKNCGIMTLEETGGAIFNVKVSATGLYQLKFHANSPHADKIQKVTITNSVQELEYSVGFPITIDQDHKTNEWEDISVYVHLENGENTIKFEVVNGWVNFEYMEVSPCEFAPKISPCYNNFYKNSVRDLVYCVELNEKNLVRICTEAGAEIPFSLREITSTEIESGYAYGRKEVVIAGNSLSDLPLGENKICFEFNDNFVVKSTLNVAQAPTKHAFEIVAFDIDHGNSVLLKLPNGKNLLIDSAKPEYFDSVISPYLEKNKLSVDYYLLTHNHGDHNGRLPEIAEKYGFEIISREVETEVINKPYEEKISRFKNQRYFDNFGLLPRENLADFWDLGGVSMTVLNSRYFYDENGNLQIWDDGDENTMSLSLQIEYGGFKYHHAADNYAKTQDAILRNFADDTNFLKTDLYYSNHHFFGSVGVEFVKFIDPKLVFVSSNAAVYSKGAFSTRFLCEIEKHCLEKGRLIETIRSCEIGSLIVKVNSNEDFTYEIYADIAND